MRLAEDVLARVEAENLETVRILFADQHGILRGKTIVASGLASAFRNGIAVTSTLLLKDTSHRTVFPVWSDDIGFGEGTLTGAGDIVMVPDPATFRMLPWSPHSGWLLCDLYYKDGRPIPFSPRSILRDAIDRLSATGKRLVCGLEVEFHVYRITDPKLAHTDGGMPAAPPETTLLSHGYQYLTDARYDALEEVMDDLRRACEQLGLPVRSMEAEFGPEPVRIHLRARRRDGARRRDDAVSFAGKAGLRAKRPARHLHVPTEGRPRHGERLAPAPVGGGRYDRREPLHAEAGRHALGYGDAAGSPACSTTPPRPAF